ncbi:MAG: hypothetical protein JW946_04090 [Candidatus Omnitrophica bacterium]|nr:hypothetical protein [Candidatus Omnitrophota bacterium]
MKYAKIFMLALCILAVLPGSLSALGTQELFFNTVPAPRLISPVTEIVNLAGKDTLKFSWSPHETAAGFKMYNDFRIYKGYETKENTLIFKNRVKPNEWNINVGSALFENNQVYTWSLKFVFSEGRNSQKSYQSFKVIKN